MSKIETGYNFIRKLTYPKEKQRGVLHRLYDATHTYGEVDFFMTQDFLREEKQIRYARLILLNKKSQKRYIVASLINPELVNKKEYPDLQITDYEIKKGTERTIGFRREHIIYSGKHQRPSKTTDDYVHLSKKEEKEFVNEIGMAQVDTEATYKKRESMNFFPIQQIKN
jgi:hypothetical protein